MRPVIFAIAAILLALGAVEGVAYWWMHPAPAGLGEPVLVYRPGFRGQVTEVRRQEPEGSDQETAGGVAPNPTSTFNVGSSMLDVPSSSLPLLTPNSVLSNSSASSSIQNSKSNIQNLSSSLPPSTLNSQLSTLNSQLSTSPASSFIQNSKPNIQNLTPPSVTPLPEVVAKALPSLHCTTGTAARIDREDGVTIHTAFFEWDLSSSRNVLEAFKHLPDECMGSIGMTLISKEKPIAYTVRGQETGDRGQQMLSAEPNSESKIQNSKFAPQSLTFDHTIFRDPGGAIIHAFKGTWVSGSTDLLGPGVRGGVELWNQIRRNSAFKRFRPAHARVVQGAVRGIPNPDLAWEAFEEAMLRDLSFQ